MTSKDFDKLPLVVDGTTIIFPCFEIMALSATPKADRAEGYAHFYDAFESRYGDQLKYFRLNDSRKWKKFQLKDRGKVSGWFSDARSLKAPQLGITLHGHAVAKEPQPPLFQMMYDHVYAEFPRGMFRIALPLDVVGEDPGPLLEFVDDLMAEFPVHWGTAGYSFYWNKNDTTIDNYAHQWLGRHLIKHPGLSTGDLFAWGSIVEQGVANIGWLTFLGDVLVEALGGVQTLAASAQEAGLGLRQYAEGVALQAGAMPELGNVNRENTLAKYAEVGRIVRPVFASDEVFERMRVKGHRDPEEKLSWARRFLP